MSLNGIAWCLLIRCFSKHANEAAVAVSHCFFSCYCTVTEFTGLGRCHAATDARQFDSRGFVQVFSHSRHPCFQAETLDITATYSLLKQRKARRESSAVRSMVREDVRALDLMGEMAKQKR